MADKKTEQEAKARRSRILAMFFLIGGTVAMLATGIVGWQLYRWGQARIAKASAAPQTSVVLVAASDLYPGVTVREGDLYAIQMPTKLLKELELNDEKLITDPAEAIGGIPQERILANEVIRRDRLASDAKGRGMNALVPRGMRALSLDLGGGQALAGLLKPGDYVDVLVTINNPESKNKETRPVLQAVYILAVNKTMVEEKVVTDATGRKRRAKRITRPTITLAVLPEDALRVTHADHKGQITLTLRNKKDLDIRDEIVVDRDSIFGEEEEEEKPQTVARRRPPPPKEKPDVLVVSHGTRETKWKLPSSGQ